MAIFGLDVLGQGRSGISMFCPEGNTRSMNKCILNKCICSLSLSFTHTRTHAHTHTAHCPRYHMHKAYKSKQNIQIIFLKHVNADVYWNVSSGWEQLQFTSSCGITELGFRGDATMDADIPACIRNSDQPTWGKRGVCCGRMCVCVWQDMCDKCNICIRWCWILGSLVMVLLSLQLFSTLEWSVSSLYIWTWLETTSAGESGHSLSLSPRWTVGFVHKKTMFERKGVCCWG